LLGGETQEVPSGDPGEGFDGDEVVASGRQPLSIVRQPAVGGRAVNVGMALECPCPGVQDGQDADQAADVVGIGRELDEGPSCPFRKSASSTPREVREATNTRAKGR